MTVEEIAAYEASVRCNSLLWLPLGRRPIPIVPGLVVYTYLQNLSVSSHLIFCLSPTPKGALDLQGALQEALALLCPENTGGPQQQGAPLLVTRLWGTHGKGETAAANQRERQWQHARLKVRWGAPESWDIYRGALRDYKEALMKQQRVRRGGLFGLHGD